MSRLSDRTRLIASATQRGQGRRPVNPPLERASTMLSDDPAKMTDNSEGPVYGLEGTSAAHALKSALCGLERAEAVTLVPSGLAAVTLPLLALLQPGDEVVATDALYGPTRRFLNRYMGARGFGSHYHPAKASTQDILSGLTPATKVLVIESPASLTFEMVDVPALAAACRDRGILTIMDNTWGAGLSFRPLDHGVDVSVQALTKYVGGHSDILMGSIATRDPAIGRVIANSYDDMGWHVSPDDCWLALRGLRTLPLRYREQAASAITVAQWLAAQPDVADVFYPPLPGSVGHSIWARDFDGAASLMGFQLKGGSQAAAYALMRQLALFGMGYSWGGFESLITYETPQLSQRVHSPDLTGSLMRIHIGLEDPQDLMSDLAAGLAAWRKAL